MDGIHDLGGREGFGPVEVSADYEGFHADWEERVFAIVRTMGRPSDWSLDWFRHCRELIDPVDYLTRPYYDQWLQTYAAMLVNSGLLSIEEIAQQKAGGPSPTAFAPPLTLEQIPANVRAAQTFDGDAGQAPQFAVGDRVQTSAHGIPGHTRLPAYIRGVAGTVTHYRGDHVMPDDNSAGTKRAEALYTVGFAARDIWPDAEGANDRVQVDLWESYLEPA
ncbi:MAG: nitrile hydratase subunit beta [Pseudomonadota bacterium]